MLDTVKLGFDQELSQKQLKGWRSHHGQQRNGYVTHKYTYSLTTPNSAMITCTYRSNSFTSLPLLTLEFFIPKLLHGNNIYQIGNLRTALPLAQSALNDLPGIPNVEIAEGEILRLDIAYNHPVNGNVSVYLDYASKQNYSRRIAIYYPKATMYFGNKTAKSKFYNKHKQSGLEDARGLLRQEISHRNKKRIREIFGASKLGDLTFSPIIAELEKDLSILKLDNPIPDDGRYAWKALLQAFGLYGGVYHYGMLKLTKIYPIPEIAQEVGLHPRSINRTLQRALDATKDIPIPKNESLPALSIDVEVINDKCIVFKDTANE